MANDWILDVLTDLQTFAQENGLKPLAAKLDETSSFAQAIIASANQEAALAAGGYAKRHVRSVHRPY